MKLHDMQSMIVTQHSPCISTYKVNAYCTDVVVSLMVPFGIKERKVYCLGIKGMNSSESTDAGISEQRRHDILKADKTKYAMYLNLTNKNSVHIPSDTSIEIVAEAKGKYQTISKLIYQDICQQKDILECFMMDRSIALLCGSTLNFRVMGYNHNPVNIERVNFRCGVDIFYLENLNVKQ